MSYKNFRFLLNLRSILYLKICHKFAICLESLYVYFRNRVFEAKHFSVGEDAFCREYKRDVLGSNVAIDELLLSGNCGLNLTNSV